MKKLFLLTIFLFTFIGLGFAVTPTLETNAAADTLRITDGTSGDPVTWNDVWEWGAGGGAGLVPKDGGGDARVDTFMTEVVADAVYTIEDDIWFGNAGGDATYFQSKNELIYFTDDKLFLTKAQATLELGDLSGDWGINGSMWSVAPNVTMNITVTSATFLMYASRLHGRNNSLLRWNDGTCDIRNSNLSSIANSSSGNSFSWLNTVDLSLRDVYLNNTQDLSFGVTPTIVDDYHAHEAFYPVITGSNITIENVRVSNPGVADVRQSGANTVTFKNPKQSVGTVLITNASGVIKEQYTINIHVIDKNGIDIETANVTCNDTDGASVFDVNTDAGGDIAEQTADYKKWTGTDETLTEHSPHTFVISKTGYRTQTIITDVDVPIDWEVELDDGDTVIYDSTLYDMTIY